MKKENHITYEDKIRGVVFLPTKKSFKNTKLSVRYSLSNLNDSVSFSDDKHFLVMFDVGELKKLLKKYEEDSEE